MRVAVIASLVACLGSGCMHQHQSKASSGATVAGIGLVAAALGGLALAAPSEDENYDSYQHDEGDDALAVGLLIGGLATALVGAMVASDREDPEPSYMVSAYPPPCMVCVVPLPPPPPPPSPCPCPAPY
jgi:hypothetical protein